MPGRRRASGAALCLGDPDLSKPGGPKTKPHKSENGSQCKPRESRRIMGAAATPSWIIMLTSAVHRSTARRRSSCSRPNFGDADARSNRKRGPDSDGAKRVEGSV
jgi:hypothetical protein